jgi:hypothetical protein
MPLRATAPQIPSVGGMDLPFLLIGMVVIATVVAVRVLVQRKARERADREPQVPTMPRAIGTAVFGLVLLAFGIAMLVTADDLSAGTGSGRLAWLPAWIQVLGLVAAGAYFLVLAFRTYRGVQERRRRGADAPAFDPLAADTDVRDETRP